MAIALEFIDFVVPRSKIEEKYPGGWEACLRDHEGLIGGRVWHDEHLFRDGAMNPLDIKALVKRWERRGFQSQEMGADGKPKWEDVCVVEAMFGGPTLQCDWIVVDTTQRIAYLAGTDPGDVIGRGQYD